MTHVKEENETYVGGVRLWINEALDREPVGTDRDTEIGKLWVFFLELVGHNVDNTIQKLEVVNLDAFAEECECDAALEGDETKSKHPCSCTGSGAIITFRSALAAGKLKKQLTDHKNWHPQGFADKGKRQKDGSVEFCPYCCYNNKQLKIISKRPVGGRSVPEEEAEDDSLNDAITNEQIQACGMILTAVLGLWSIDFVAVIKDAVKDTKVVDAKAQISKSVHDILEDPKNQEDIPTEKTKDEIKRIIRKTIEDLVVNKPDGVDLKEVKEWGKKYQKEPETVTLDEEGEKEEELYEAFMCYCNLA